MIELLGLAGGAIARLIPVLVDFFKQKQDLKYEVMRLDREIELEKQRAAGARQEAAQASANKVDEQWAQGLVEALKGEVNRPTSGYPFLDWISSSVRPILTYWWCIFLYSVHKGFIVYASIHEDLGAKAMAEVVLTDFDRAVVSSIIGF
ncbi:MAG TPA: hypothetical protein VJ323_09545, partial [Bryobacteraceae bacterium]|nr:hypothetical protein [Bryobacteraceae bacterium]